MSKDLVESPAAIVDVLHIAEYLAAQASLDMSDRFLAAAKAAYRQLAFMPGMGMPKNYGPNYPNLRAWPIPKFPNHLIFYEVKEAEIRILRVLHGAQDREAIFNPLAEE